MLWIVTVVIMAIAIGFLLIVLKWKIATEALLYYMEKKQYKLPNDAEMKECVKFVIRHSVKDYMPK